MEKRASGAIGKTLNGVYGVLESLYGPQKCFLEHRTPFQLLVATILSAQCTDKMVNLVTRELFRRAPEAGAMAFLPLPELESLVRKCGYYRAKARHIHESASVLVKDYGGKIPSTMEELLRLPGVGRKTANVVLSDAFGVPGLPVDTHVKRIANLLGVVDTDDPEKIEETLCANLEPAKWGEFSHLLIVHGRTRCPAGRPDCANCPILIYCKTGKKKGRHVAETKIS